MAEPDYITLAPTADPRKFLVVIMKWHERDDQYVQGRVSGVHSRPAAQALAEAWQAATGLEIRV